MKPDVLEMDADLLEPNRWDGMNVFPMDFHDEMNG
jgi:hypothetical protein